MDHASGNEPGSFFILPFLRPADGEKGAIVVESEGGAPVEITVDVMRPNGQKATSETANVAGRGEVCADLFALECGAAHVAIDGGQARAWLRTGTHEAPFSDVDSLAGTEFRIDRTDPDAPFAVLANATGNEIFSFVNDNQGPMIPPGGAAKIRIPEPGGELRVTVESGDAVLAYRGAPVRPSR